MPFSSTATKTNRALPHWRLSPESKLSEIISTSTLTLDRQEILQAMELLLAHQHGRLLAESLFNHWLEVQADNDQEDFDDEDDEDDLRTWISSKPQLACLRW